MNFKSILSICAFGGLLLASSCKETPKKAVAKNDGPSTKIAYVNLDTLDAKYQYILDGKVKFEAEQKEMEAELKKLEDAIKGQYAALQRKINDKSISEVEYETIGKRIQNMEQNYQKKMQSLQGDLMAKTDSFQTSYRKKLDDFLSEYNKEGIYDYILSYQYGVSLVLFANKELDITGDVVEGLNDLYYKETSSEKPKKEEAKTKESTDSAAAGK